jgi:GntR family transcriptional regulator
MFPVSGGLVATPNRPTNAAGPLYARLADSILLNIESGRWRPGDQIPTEIELGRAHGVSRAVVRQAVGTLATKGILRRAQGRGTFVASARLPQGPRRLLSFTQDMLSRGLTPGSTLLSAHLAPATGEVAERLKLGEGDPVWIVSRLRRAGNEPMGLQTAHLPARVCPDLPIDRLGQGSLYSLLRERYGIVPARASETYVATELSKEEARLLETRAGAAGLTVERTTFDGSGRVFEYVRSVMRGDRYQVSLELEAEV